ncbi:hypothetical protein Lal_00036651 [Lupinus albus]|nr:hypothetical protein Lal_00036651 [Lupinus albus]
MSPSLPIDLVLILSSSKQYNDACFILDLQNAMMHACILTGPLSLPYSLFKKITFQPTYGMGERYNFWQNLSSESVLQVIRNTTFGNILDIGASDIKNHLITTLVERWRPKTHIFYLPNGECTIVKMVIFPNLWLSVIDYTILILTMASKQYLGEGSNINHPPNFNGEHYDFWKIRMRIFIESEDVAYQLGLSSDEDVVTGATSMDWDFVYLNLLGAIITDRQIMGQMVQMKLPEDANDVLIQQHGRVFILRMIGGFLMPDTSGSRAHLMYLSLLEDLSQTYQYNWGSTILACLYRGLCRAT